MDILAHMLWANYGARAINKKQGRRKRPINLPWVTFWGVFPDLFAFGIPIALGIFASIGNGFSDFHRPDMLGLPATLYQYSHSLVIWAAVFIIAWIASKRPRLDLLGWALHILIDIPSHSASFYPTPFLFPLSDYRFIHGVSWSNTTYMIINYILLLIVSLYFFLPKKNRTPKK
ncbi:MAG: hypothetical protein V4665_00290 [Patescibacteria group bacterium]